jgi:hypothetical protein
MVVISVEVSATTVLMNSQQSNQANNQNSQTNNQNNQTNNQASPQSWIKKGAYAAYEGNATILS